MAAPNAGPIVRVNREVAARLHARAKGERWGLSVDDFAAALQQSAAHRYREERPTEQAVEEYLAGLHLEDLALAVACARGVEAAWTHFVGEYRPAVLAAARSCAPEDTARELADSLYADLFGLDSRDGVRRSLFDYFHGRSALVGWLRAVLAQRLVDRARAALRFEPLPDDPAALGASPESSAPDVDRGRYLRLVRLALAAALAALAPRDRLRLTLYYARQMRLAAVGRLLGESEATASRKLERTRAELRGAIERGLRDNGLSNVEIACCFEYAASDPAFDISKALPVTNGELPG
ncbi:MAG: RNA polymerase sigma factor [Bacteroidales bacterium]